MAGINHQDMIAGFTFVLRTLCLSLYPMIFPFLIHTLRLFNVAI